MREKIEENQVQVINDFGLMDKLLIVLNANVKKEECTRKGFKTIILNFTTAQEADSFLELFLDEHLKGN